jgi:hypothetical protein
MADQAPKQALPAVVDDVHAPLIFADELVGAGSLQGNINLTFAVVQYDHSKNPAKPYRKVCLRLVLPTAAVRAIAQLVGQAQGPQANSTPAAAAKTNVQ